jgi:uncharacterized membrane protein YgdD (TMEM256/DUF423 family)
VSGRALVATGALLGASAVALGAFGAHGLQGVLSPGRLATFETAVRYQLVHAVLVAALGLTGAATPAFRRAGVSLVAGVILFAGSLYAVVASGVGAFGMVAPLGGALMVLGWVLLGWAALGPRERGR